MKYDVNYFIKKFESKPELLWAVGIQWDQYGRSCALGDCSTSRGVCNGEETPEGKALDELFIKYLGVHVPIVNNGWDFIPNYLEPNENDIRIASKYDQPTPKQRILAALYDIKRMKEGEVDPPRPVTRVEESQSKVEYKLVYSDQKVKDLVNEKLILS